MMQGANGVDHALKKHEKPAHEKRRASLSVFAVVEPIRELSYLSPFYRASHPKPDVSALLLLARPPSL
jgi:hypothetical protein